MSQPTPQANAPYILAVVVATDTKHETKISPSIPHPSWMAEVVGAAEMTEEQYLDFVLAGMRSTGKPTVAFTDAQLEEIENEVPALDWQN